MDEKNEFREKIRSINFGGKKRGKTEVKPVINEDTGKIGGRQIEHWDGRVDAVVTPEPGQLKLKLPQIQE